MILVPEYLEAFDLKGERATAAIEAESNVLCLAGPGAGKTHLLAAHAVHQLHTQPGRVVLLTFSRGSANEMLSRVIGAISDPMLSTRVVAHTIHAHAFELLQTHGRTAGYTGSLRPLSERELRTVVREALDRAGIDRATAKATTWLERYRRLGRGAPEPSADAKRFVTCLEELMLEEDVIDYGGAVTHAADLLRQFPAVATSVQRHDRCILLDEAQDCDPAQLELLDECLSGGGHLFVAMDPEQSLYGWRQADPVRNLEWARGYCATKVRLTENFRCSARVHAIARSVLEAEAPRLSGSEGIVEVRRVSDLAEEARLIAEDIQRSGRPGRTAVLAYARWRLEQVEQALKDASVPYTTQTLQWSEQEDRVLRGLTLVDAQASHLPGEATQESGDFDAKSVAALRELASERRAPLQLVHSVAAVLGVGEAGLNGLLSMAGSARSLATLLKNASNGPEERQVSPGAVSVSTFHGAKGREFETVFVAGVEHGRVPHKNARTKGQVEESRRALYVAITRAEKRVVLTYTGAPSRFLSNWLAGQSS